jgi:hypothetical protein
MSFIIDPIPIFDGAGLVREAETEDTEPGPGTGVNSDRIGSDILSVSNLTRKEQNYE